MKPHDLSFAKIIILNDNTAEVIVNEGVELNLEMVDQYHEFLLTHLNAPFSVLINKLNRYTYDFQAQCKIGVLEELSAIAIVVYNRMAELSTDVIIDMPREIKWNTKTFKDRDSALTWLLPDDSSLQEKESDLLSNVT